MHAAHEFTAPTVCDSLFSPDAATPDMNMMAKKYAKRRSLSATDPQLGVSKISTAQVRAELVSE